jgi:AcrR family transcriptional regulator
MFHHATVPFAMGTAVQARTRRAILDAAVRTLTADAGASLAAIATEAGVGRTTLHRYFPDRGDLLRAISADALQRAAEAVERARIEDGPAPDALERLCQEYFDLGDVLMLLYSESRLMETPEWHEETEADRAVIGLIARGQAEGTLDPDVPVAWIQMVLWGLMYTAWEHVRTNQAPKHEALTLCLRTIRRAVVVSS